MARPDGVSLPRFELRGRQGSVAHELYLALSDAIFDGRLQPGQALVEGAVAKAANVSRTPVREALHRLENDGLITGGGTKKVAFPSRTELRELMTVREALEGLASALAANARTSLDVEVLTDVHRSYERAASQGAGTEVIVDLNDRFHQTIWQTAQNRYLSSQLSFLRKMVQRLQTASTLEDPLRLAATVEEHRLILRSIIDRDVEQAEAVTRSHFRRAGALRIAMLDALA